MSQYKKMVIQSKEELLKHLISYNRGWLFRGQACASWQLESTLERLLSCVAWDADLARKCEDYSLHIFQSKAHHYISKGMLPQTKLGWLALMQHHGVPTRLLDFTESPFVALFFAFSGVSPLHDEDCSVWALNYRTLMKQSLELVRKNFQDFKLDYNEVQMQPDNIFQKYVDPNKMDVLWVTDPLLSNLRLERQKGTFLLRMHYKIT